jgi:hypothetical protein
MASQELWLDCLVPSDRGEHWVHPLSRDHKQITSPLSVKFCNCKMDIMSICRFVETVTQNDQCTEADWQTLVFYLLPLIPLLGQSQQLKLPLYSPAGSKPSADFQLYNPTADATIRLHVKPVTFLRFIFLLSINQQTNKHTQGELVMGYSQNMFRAEACLLPSYTEPRKPPSLPEEAAEHWGADLGMWTEELWATVIS